MKTSAQLAQLGPFEQLRTGKLARRLFQLMVGLAFYGISMALMIRGNLGLAPWDALHVGVTQHLPISFGWVVIGVSFLVLLFWIPLRELPGIGTLANATVIGIVADLVLQVMGAPEHLVLRLAFTIGGVLLCGLSTALYIGAQLGRGPRDGLMTGLHRVTGLSLGAVRTCLEIAVLLAGILLGGLGLLGIGTVLFALSIGPLTQILLPWMIVPLDSGATRQPPTGTGITGIAMADIEQPTTDTGAHHGL